MSLLTAGMWEGPEDGQLGKNPPRASTGPVCSAGQLRSPLAAVWETVLPCHSVIQSTECQASSLAAHINTNGKRRETSKLL